MDAINDMSRARKHKPRPMPSGTLDSLGGGNILRADSPDPNEYNFRSLELLVSYQVKVEIEKTFWLLVVVYFNGWDFVIKVDYLNKMI